MLTRMVLCASLFLCSAVPGVAQTNISLGGMAVDTTSAIEVTADSLAVDQDNGTAFFEGEVLIVQGDLRLSADQVEVLYNADASEISRLLAEGSVLFVTAEEAAEAETADYDVASGLLVMTGDVLLTQGGSAIAANKMTINVTDGTAQMDGRVRTVLQQGSDN